MENSTLVIFPIRHSLDLLSESQARQHDCSYGVVYAMVKGFVYWVKSKEMRPICPVEAGVGVSVHRRNSKPKFRPQRSFFCYRLSEHQLKSQFERKGTVAKCATVPDIALCGLRSLCDCCPKHDFLAIACHKIANPVFACRPTIAFDAVCKICNDFLSIGF